MPAITVEMRKADPNLNVQPAQFVSNVLIGAVAACSGLL